MNIIRCTALITGIIAFVAFTSCKTQHVANPRIYPVDSADTRIDNGMIYGLPKTQLMIDVKIKKKTILPGPYHEFGEKLLGLSNVTHQEKNTWNIADLAIRETTHMDYDHLYVIEPEGRFRFDWSKFTRRGWIIPFDEADKMYAFQKTDFYRKKDYSDRIYHDDLSVKKFVGKETKTVYKRVWKDSIFARVPVTETNVVNKTKAEKAQEAANFIFMIREKRFELISGMGDYYPEGTAMEAAIEEMNRLENKYLALFTGTQRVDSIEYTIPWTPQKNSLSEPEMLFRFSPQQGIMEQNANQGVPVWIEADTLEHAQKMEDLFNNHWSSAHGVSFYYRIPLRSIITVQYGEQVMARKFLDISQYGPVIRIPYPFLKDSQIIEFFPSDEDQK